MYTQVQFKSEKDAKLNYNLRKREDEFSNVTFKLENDIITYDGPRRYGYDGYDHSNIFLAVGEKTSFITFLDDNKFFDVELIVINGKKEYVRKLHKIILTNATDFFDVALVKIKIEEPIDVFDKLIDIIYGKVTRIHGVEGLKILQLMDKYGVKFNQYVEKEFEIEDYIGEMGIPGKEEVIEYLDALKNIFSNGFTEKVEFHWDNIAEFYDYNSEADIMAGIRKYVLNSLEKRNNQYNDEDDDDNNNDDNNDDNDDNNDNDDDE